MTFRDQFSRFAHFYDFIISNPIKDIIEYVDPQKNDIILDLGGGTGQVAEHLAKYSRETIIVDPSHSSGRREMIKSLSWAAIAAGADGLLIETHFSPDNTVCDSKQTIDMEILKDILEGNEKLLKLWNRK